MPRRRATARRAWEVTRRAQILVSAVPAGLLGLYDVKMRLQIRYARSLSAETRAASSRSGSSTRSHGACASQVGLRSSTRYLEKPASRSLLAAESAVARMGSDVLMPPPQPARSRAATHATSPATALKEESPMFIPSTTVRATSNE